MGVNMSKDKKMIREAVNKFKIELEVFHQKYMLGVGSERELYHRRIDYASVLQIFYERLMLQEIKCNEAVRFELIKKPNGLKIVISIGYAKVKEFINFSPYYMPFGLSGRSYMNTDTTPISEQIKCPENLKPYLQYC